MAERKKNPKAEAAMAIADKYKEIVTLSDLMRAKLWNIDEMGKAEPALLDKPLTYGLRSAAHLVSRHASHRQAYWHNVAFGRGYFETVEGPKKLSKFNQ